MQTNYSVLPLVTLVLRVNVMILWLFAPSSVQKLQTVLSKTSPNGGKLKREMVHGVFLPAINWRHFGHHPGERNQPIETEKEDQKLM